MLPSWVHYVLTNSLFDIFHLVFGEVKFDLVVSHDFQDEIGEAHFVGNFQVVSKVLVDQSRVKTAGDYPHAQQGRLHQRAFQFY